MESGIPSISDALSKACDALGAFDTPWLKQNDPLQSLKGAAELFSVGEILANEPSFADNATEELRRLLGDWRDAPTWLEFPAEIEEPRSERYSEIGFDPALTDFPEAAFHRITVEAGVRPRSQHPVELLDHPVKRREGEDHADTQQKMLPYDWISSFEIKIRNFIVRRLSQHYGTSWHHQCLPSGMLDSWRDRKEAAERRGLPTRPIIEYADFTDYEKIICKSENWKKGFQKVFMRRESLQESLYRLYPARLDTMHSRAISQGDLLLIYVEVKRIDSAIEASDAQ